jgi:flagellin-like protein
MEPRGGSAGPYEDRSQSEVIGEVLLVGIVVILVAVLATFALDLGGVIDTDTPTAGFSFEYDEAANELTITHESGDRLDRATVEVRGDDGGVTAVANWPEPRITAGDRFVAGSVADEETVRVVWNDGKTSAILGRWPPENR